MSAGHDHGRPTASKALWIAIILNGSFLVLEAIIGWWTNSLALLADAGHMVSDVGALGIALFASHLSARGATERYTFGLKRAPVLGGLVNGASLLAIVALIVAEAIDRFDAPPNLDAVPVLWTGIAGLGVNLVSAWYLARSQDRSVNIRGAMLHLLADALGSVAAIISALAIMFWSFPLADPIASLLIALFILVGSLPLLRDTFRILLQRAPADLSINDVRGVLAADPRVKEVHDLHVWELDSGEPILTVLLEVSCATLEDANRLADDLRQVLIHDFSIDHATIECRHGNAALNCDSGQEVDHSDHTH